jgi:hypothetical protein
MTASETRPGVLCMLIALYPLVALGATSPKPKRITWKGVETFEDAYTYSGRNSGVLGHANLYRAKVDVNFTYVEETDTQGNSHFLSKNISWTVTGKAVANGYEATVCQGADGASVLGRENQPIPISCKNTKFSSYWGFFPHPPSSVSPPKTINWDQLRDDCSYSEEEPLDHGYHRYSVSVSGDLDSVMDVSIRGKDAYWQFVPEPGKKIAFSVRSNIPARFRFTLQNVSHFPGYASNAKVDSDFFSRYGLEHLSASYNDNGPDLIFDPKDFEYNKKFWVRPPANMQGMETSQDATAASVTVTAMDFGAYGNLRAEAKTKCSGWQPVHIRLGGRDAAFVTIPLDEDNNLIADRMEQPKNGITDWAYAGGPGIDADAAPPNGDGTGDGLTTFEEYRGFVVEEHPGDPWSEVHVRTDPTTKDIFITSDDAMLERMTGVFAEVSGLDVHTINNFHFVQDPVTTAPIVNFTLQENGPKQWNGKVISQATPQHGIRIIDRTLEDGENGRTVPVGRPRDVQYVEIDKDKCLLKSLRADPTLTKKQRNELEKLGDLQLARVVTHELGHAMNIPHHGEGNMQIMVLLNQGSCPPGAVKGSVSGKPACRFEQVAVRHQQNSGNQECPMKYIWWRWYFPDNSYLASADVMANCRGQNTSCVDFNDGSSSESLPAYTGDPPKPYFDKVVTKEIDFPSLMAYCTSNQGTGINALPGDQNRAGNAPDGVWCARKLHVNDTQEVH